MVKFDIGLLDDYAQAVVEDMSIEDLMNEVKDSIYQRLMQEPFADVVAEITQSPYDELLDKYGVPRDE